MSQLSILDAAPAPAGAAPAPTAPTAPTVIGLDLALGLTGVAGTGWADYISTGARRAEERLDYILCHAQSFYRNADFVALEGPSYGHAHQTGHDEMAGLRWLVRRDLYRRKIPFAIVPPDNRTIFAIGNARPKDPKTGKALTGKPLKAVVAAAAAEQYGIAFEGRSKYDQADAYVIHAMARHYLGHPLAELPATHTRALASVAWPERTDQ
ncbi:hypothetical protein BX265_4995 [Streptomyces sp. TLI_235]|nr:hypothetical protein [Streptomyces sp. TLI_235]PBC80159.1 hypothetical protein BX265_4995 [Streptomyces sp. TLI_235]